MIEKIISGGQTGADRAALDFAIYHDIPHGGWCPKGRLAEDGVIEPRYQLRETSTKNYPERTEKNVREADGTVIFTIAPKLTGGSNKTAQLAAKLHEVNANSTGSANQRDEMDISSNKQVATVLLDCRDTVKPSLARTHRRYCLRRRQIR